MVVALTTVKWTIDDYHRMIEAGILSDRKAELLWGKLLKWLQKGTPMPT